MALVRRGQAWVLRHAVDFREMRRGSARQGEVRRGPARQLPIRDKKEKTQWQKQKHSQGKRF